VRNLLVSNSGNSRRSSGSQRIPHKYNNNRNITVTGSCRGKKSVIDVRAPNGKLTEGLAKQLASSSEIEFDLKSQVCIVAHRYSKTEAVEHMYMSLYCTHSRTMNVSQQSLRQRSQR
jgi:hypothetical protein